MITIDRRPEPLPLLRLVSERIQAFVTSTLNLVYITSFVKLQEMAIEWGKELWTYVLCLNRH